MEVYWAETGCWFAATTADASAEDCQTGFSVIYDELVDGQRVRENHVSNDRLRPLLVPPLLTVVEADSLLENPVGSPARHAEGESLSAQSPPAAVSVGSIMRSFISELGVFMAEGRVETDQWFSRKPLAERRSLLRIASSVAATAADGPGSLILRFLADVILASPSYGIIDKKAFAARFIDLSVAGLSDSDAAKGSKRGKGVGLLPVSEACSLLHSELFEDSVRGRSVPLGDLEIALRAGVLLLDASLAHAGGGEMSADDAPAVLSEDVMGAIMQVGSQCIALMEFVAKLPSTASAVAKVGEQEIEPTADIDEGDGDFSANKAQQKPKRGSKKSGARTEAHRQAFCGSAAFLIQEMVKMCRICYRCQ